MLILWANRVPTKQAIMMLSYKSVSQSLRMPQAIPEAVSQYRWMIGTYTGVLTTTRHSHWFWILVLWDVGEIPISTTVLPCVNCQLAAEISEDNSWHTFLYREGHALRLERRLPARRWHDSNRARYRAVFGHTASVSGMCQKFDYLAIRADLTIFLSLTTLLTAFPASWWSPVTLLDDLH